MRCSETANSCEAVGGQSTSVNRNPLSTNLCDVSSNVDNQTTTITDTNMSQIASGEHPVNEATNQQPPTDGISERKETTEELEAFLFGDLPCVAKTPPRKKCKKGAEFATGPTKVEPGFVKPSLTFDSTKWSPSRQRDLLSIAQDIAKLQRSLESGDLPQEPVSKLVSFTKPSD